MVLVGSAPQPQHLGGSAIRRRQPSSFPIPGRKTLFTPAGPASAARRPRARRRGLRPSAASQVRNLAPAAFPRRLVSTPAPRPSPPGLPAADSTAALAAGIFISFTAPEFPTSARLSRPALLAAVVCMGLAGPPESTSARLPPQVLRASEVSMPAAVMGWRGHRSPHRRACLPKFCGRRDFPCRRGFHGFAGGGREPRTSARQRRQVLLGEGFMALEGAELSRAAARPSDKAASDIAERAGRYLFFGRS